MTSGETARVGVRSKVVSGEGGFLGRARRDSKKAAVGMKCSLGFVRSKESRKGARGTATMRTGGRFVEGEAEMKSLRSYITVVLLKNPSAIVIIRLREKSLAAFHFLHRSKTRLDQAKA